MSPTTPSLGEQLLQIEEASAQQQFIQSHAPDFGEADFQVIKDAADKYLRANLARSRQYGEVLIALADAGASKLARALGIIVAANAEGISGVGEYARAIELYEEAATLYAELGRPRDQARIQIGIIYCLSNLGRWDEIAEIDNWARKILESEEDWVGLSRLTSNLGIAYSRKGDEVTSLAMFNDGRDYCLRAGPHQNTNLPNIEHNRSLALRNLGRFEESIAASQQARALHLEAGSHLEAARTLQNLATTYFILGRYNEALADLDQVRQAFLEDGRTRDLMRVELYISDCLLQLRRFQDVLAKCSQVREQFTAKGLQHEVAQAILNEAIAYGGLGRFEEAEAALSEAESIFRQENNEDAIAYLRLQQATLLYERRLYTESVKVALESIAAFDQLERPVERAYAHLIAARSLLALNQPEGARAEVAAAMLLGEQSTIPALTYQCRHLLGAIANAQGDPTRALAEYDAAMEALEHLRGRLMLEFRAAYVEDKQGVYEDAVLLCVEADRPAQALAYAERAKSRALLDLLAQRLELRVEARSAADQPLLDELSQLRSQRDQLYRQWESNDEHRPSSFVTREPDYQQAQLAVAALEQRITDLWHTLLIRNADYAGDAALWRTRSEEIQPILAPESILLEYYVAREQFIVFLVTREAIESIKLPIDGPWLHNTLRLLRLNMTAVPVTPALPQLAQLQANAIRILQRLYDELLRPLAGKLTGYRHLIIAPHGPLHYLPFHALHDGSAYLLQNFEISYLPSASFLQYCRAPRPTSDGAPSEGKRLLAFGHSGNGQLPFAIAEAEAVAQRMDGRAYLEAEATKARLAEVAPQAAILHFAAHADFRADNPLFSGLSLADGWLTTLDIFELKVPVALATLSACQTGRSVIGGGDELLGLMRAWISAGAASLVLSYWPVEDASARALMEHFYTALAAGESKRAALRAAQLHLCNSGSLPHSHPYFWAAYFLVGDAGPL